MSHTGKIERLFVKDALTPLCGGRVYQTAAPDSEKLERYPDGTVKPYIVYRFRRPFMSRQGRSVAGGEKKQPYILTWNVTAFAGDPTAADDTLDEVDDRLLDAQPSTTASVIQRVGGFAFDNSDASSRPTRFASGSQFQAFINLG